MPASSHGLGEMQRHTHRSCIAHCTLGSTYPLQRLPAHVDGHAEMPSNCLPHLCQAHLHKENHQDLAPAFGLCEGTVSGQVAALDRECVMAHAQDCDASGESQDIMEA